MKTPSSKSALKTWDTHSSMYFSLCVKKWWWKHIQVYILNPLEKKCRFAGLVCLDAGHVLVKPSSKHSKLQNLLFIQPGNKQILKTLKKSGCWSRRGLVFGLVKAHDHMKVWCLFSFELDSLFFISPPSATETLSMTGLCLQFNICRVLLFQK